MVPRKDEGSYRGWEEQEMGSYRASRVSSLPQTKLKSYVKDRQESRNEAIKQNWVGIASFALRRRK
jgi:hypothetical protein